MRRDQVEVLTMLRWYFDFASLDYLVACENELREQESTEFQLVFVGHLINLGLRQKAQQTGKYTCTHGAKGDHLEQGLIEIIIRFVRKSPDVECVHPWKDLHCGRHKGEYFCCGEALLHSRQHPVGA